MSQSAFVTDGAKVRLMRDRAGFTQAGFAKELGIHRTSLSKIERSERQPGIELRNLIAAKLGVGVDAIASIPAAA